MNFVRKSEGKRPPGELKWILKKQDRRVWI
jgi:hypothetical protein